MLLKLFTVYHLPFITFCALRLALCLQRVSLQLKGLRQILDFVQQFLDGEVEGRLVVL